VFLNSGIQRSFDFAKPASVNLDWINDEFTINYLSFLHLTKAFMPHLQNQQNETGIIYTTSGLALIPMARCPNYCASKAALHHFILTLREQMKNGPGSVRVIELMPPAVQTELHNKKNQPDLSGAAIGMPLNEFTDEAWSGLEKGEEQIVIGLLGKKAADTWEKERQESFHQLAKMAAAQAKK
jgi:short-subunit dehydrogenase involved in D-alanine esterification of teichoic acids